MLENDDTIRSLAYRYAQLIDNRDYDNMSEVLLDGCDVTGPSVACHSLEEFRETFKQQLSRYSSTYHLIGNVLGEWRDDKWLGETYCTASLVYSQDGVERKLDLGIRYEDTVVKDGGSYKYSKRALTVVWQQDLPTKLTV